MASGTSEPDTASQDMPDQNISQYVSSPKGKREETELETYDDSSKNGGVVSNGNAEESVQDNSEHNTSCGTLCEVMKEQMALPISDDFSKSCSAVASGNFDESHDLKNNPKRQSKSRGAQPREKREKMKLPKSDEFSKSCGAAASGNDEESHVLENVPKKQSSSHGTRTKEKREKRKLLKSDEFSKSCGAVASGNDEESHVSENVPKKQSSSRGTRPKEKREKRKLPKSDGSSQNGGVVSNRNAEESVQDNSEHNTSCGALCEVMKEEMALPIFGEFSKSCGTVSSGNDEEFNVSEKDPKQQSSSRGARPKKKREKGKLPKSDATMVNPTMDILKCSPNEVAFFYKKKKSDFSKSCGAVASGNGEKSHVQKKDPKKQSTSRGTRPKEKREKMESPESDDDSPPALQNFGLIVVGSRINPNGPVALHLAFQPAEEGGVNVHFLSDSLQDFWNFPTGVLMAKPTLSGVTNLKSEDIAGTSRSGQPLDPIGIVRRVRQMQGAEGPEKDEKNAEKSDFEPQFQQSLTPVPDLTVDALRLIFKNLNYKDLYSMQFVNKLWYEAVHKPWLWAKYVFELRHGMPIEELLYKLRHLLAIQSIRCNYILPKHHEDKILTEMLDKLEFLKVIHFYGGIPAVYVKEFVEKYENLNSIKLNFYAEDILESLGYLNSCKALNELIFTGVVPPAFSLKRLAEAMSILATGFSHLKHLDTRGILTTTHKFNTDVFKTVLKGKSAQLLSLKFTFDERINPEVLEEINKCTKLEHLLLEVKHPKLSNTFHNLTNLQSLNLEFDRAEQGTLDDIFEKSFILSRMPFLRVLRVCVYKAQTDKKRFLNKVIEEAPQLEELEMIGMNVDLLSRDMKHIQNLSKLKSLSVRKCNPTDDADIKHISLCKSLESLKVGSSNLTAAAINYLADCSTLKSLLFTECRFGVEVITYLMLKLELLESLSVSFAQHSVENKILFRIRDEVHPNLKLHII